MTHQASQKKVETGTETRSQILIRCPVTGEQAKKLTENCIVIPNGQANWWHCSACRGWHINLEHKLSRSLVISQ